MTKQHINTCCSLIYHGWIFIWSRDVTSVIGVYILLLRKMSVCLWKKCIYPCFSWCAGITSCRAKGKKFSSFNFGQHCYWPLLSVVFSALPSCPEKNEIGFAVCLIPCEFNIRTTNLSRGTKRQIMSLCFLPVYKNYAKISLKKKRSCSATKRWAFVVTEWQIC